MPAPLVRLALRAPPATPVLRVNPGLAASLVLQANKVQRDQPAPGSQRESALAIAHPVPDYGYPTRSAVRGNMPSAAATPCGM